MKHYVTSIRLSDNPLVHAVYDKLREYKESGAKIYFMCNEGRKAALAYRREYARQDYDIFSGVIGYVGERTDSSEAVAAYAKYKEFDETKDVFVLTDDENEEEALVEAGIPCDNFRYYDRALVLGHADIFIPTPT